MSISSAIQNRQLLSLSYNGYPRVVEPHCYGTDTKGHLALRAYQVRGGSESGEYVGWKLFNAKGILQLVTLSDRFAAARIGYKKNDKAFTSIQAQL